MWAKIIFIVLLSIVFKTNCHEINKSVNSEDEERVTRRFSSYKPSLHSTKSQKKINWKSLGEDRIDVPVRESTTEISAETTTLQVTTRKFQPVTSSTIKTTIAHKKSKKLNSTKQGACDHFKPSKENLDLNKMADVWQTVYYQLPEKVHCFKIHIKKLGHEEKKQLSFQYGNFSGIVNWDECNLEVKSESQHHRRHFLQGTNKDQGVMDNIIITASDDSGDAASTVHEETADQWLVVHNMLLMRDCDTGGVVVFAKVPHAPRDHDIKIALELFNEPHVYGKLACDDEEVVKPFDAEEDINEQIN